VKDAVDKGATTLSGGQADGACYPPTVITGVTPEMRVYGEESFGPLVSVVEVDGVEEAVATANDTDYGLAAAVWSENVPAALDGEEGPSRRVRRRPGTGRAPSARRGGRA
jgi:benzaldehyde dehydrogenase (NAD)